MTSFDIVSPVDGSVYATRSYASRSEVMAAAARARKALAGWRTTAFEDRVKLVKAFLVEIGNRRDTLAEMVTWQMGRPSWQADETGRLLANGDVLVDDAAKVLKPSVIHQEENIRRAVELDPVGLCFSICAWNYPVAMASSLVTAPLLMGNVVLLKHAPQTALIAEVFAEAARAAGLPEGVYQSLHIAHADAEALIGSGLVDMVQFIGSTRGGQAVYDAGRGTFVRYGLELGGKDPVYIRADAPVEKIMDDLMEGSFGNAGQSCCSVERIYVHRDIHDRFVDCFTSATAKVEMGHPINDKPFFGPLVSAAAATRVNGLVEDAVAKGARQLMPTGKSPLVTPGGAYVEPQVLVNVDHSMAIMKDETFGPVIPIMAVDSDEQAVALMNDSDYGLTSAVWTQDIDRGLELGRQLESGMFYLNRCDHADMYLPWGGVKKSGIGRSYCEKGLEELVVPRSYHLRTLG